MSVITSYNNRYFFCSALDASEEFVDYQFISFVSPKTFYNETNLGTHLCSVGIDGGFFSYKGWFFLKQGRKTFNFLG